MDERRVDQGIRRAPRKPTRADLRTLLRSRAVQATLLATAAVNGIAVLTRDPRPAERAPIRVVGATITRPDSARPVATDSAAEGDSLAEAYRARGFHVPDELAAEIVAAADRYDIEPELAFGLVATESEFKPTALSPVGAIGLAQLMPATARLIRPGTTGSDLRDPAINLSLGFRFLRDLLVKYEGDTELALLAYNRGPGVVDRILARGGDPDNGYADKVLGRD